jgi:hypothetical protein
MPLLVISFGIHVRVLEEEYFVEGLPTSNPTLTNPAQTQGIFFHFGEVGWAGFKVGLGLGSFLGVSWSS